MMLPEPWLQTSILQLPPLSHWPKKVILTNPNISRVGKCTLLTYWEGRQRNMTKGVDVYNSNEGGCNIVNSIQKAKKKGCMSIRPKVKTRSTSTQPRPNKLTTHFKWEASWKQGDETEEPLEIRNPLISHVRVTVPAQSPP